MLRALVCFVVALDGGHGFFVARPSVAARSVVVSSDKGFGSKPASRKPASRKPSADPIPPTTADVQSPLLRQLLDQERQREEALERDIEDLKERDAYVSSTADAGRLPEVVANRMALRMATFGGIPVFGGIALFVFFYFSATKNDVVFQPTSVAAATTAPWVLGLLGIGYGALSASWDEDVEGSVVGAREFKTNLQRILEGLQRSANDAKLRETLQQETRQDRTSDANQGRWE